jgi:hypothetical protein
MNVDEPEELEAFVGESLCLFAKRGYYPTDLMRMRHQHGTVAAIEQLVCAGAIQSGFLRLGQLKMLDRSMETTVVKFPGCFSKDARKCARFRLDNISDPLLRGR